MLAVAKIVIGTVELMLDVGYTCTRFIPKKNQRQNRDWFSSTKKRINEIKFLLNLNFKKFMPL